MNLLRSERPIPPDAYSAADRGLLRLKWELACQSAAQHIGDRMRDWEALADAAQSAEREPEAPRVLPPPAPAPIPYGWVTCGAGTAALFFAVLFMLGIVKW